MYCNVDKKLIHLWFLYLTNAIEKEAIDHDLFFRFFFMKKVGFRVRIQKMKNRKRILTCIEDICVCTAQRLVFID